jgi:NAD(P)H-nitrite reductase large subunit
VIGNGMAAARLVDELAQRALGRYAVAVIGEEPRLAYNRVLLSALLADEVGFDDIELKPARWWRDRGVTLRYGERATQVDAPTRNVILSAARSLHSPSSSSPPDRSRSSPTFPAWICPGFSPSATSTTSTPSRQ